MNGPFNALSRPVEPVRDFSLYLFGTLEREGGNREMMRRRSETTGQPLQRVFRKCRLLHFDRSVRKRRRLSGGKSIESKRYTQIKNDKSISKLVTLRTSQSSFVLTVFLFSFTYSLFVYYCINTKLKTMQYAGNKRKIKKEKSLPVY